MVENQKDGRDKKNRKKRCQKRIKQKMVAFLHKFYEGLQFFHISFKVRLFWLY